MEQFPGVLGLLIDYAIRKRRIWVEMVHMGPRYEEYRYLFDYEWRCFFLTQKTSDLIYKMYFE